MCSSDLQDEPGGSGIKTNTVAGQVVTVSTLSVTNTGTCVDNANNVADPATFGPIKIDKTKPVVSVTATVGGNPYTPGTPTKGPVVVTFTCTDEVGGSGVLGTPVSTTNVTASGSVTSPACVDNATNVGDPVSFGPIVIDNSAPTVTGVEIGRAHG